jgi:hypothetical protein
MMYSLEKFILEFAPVGNWALEDCIRPFISRRVIKSGDFLLRGTDVCEKLTFINKGICYRFTRYKEHDYVTAFYFNGELAGDFNGFTPGGPVYYYIRAIGDLYVEELSFAAVATLAGFNAVFKQIFEALAAYSYCRRVAQEGAFQHTRDVKYLNLAEQRSDGIRLMPRNLMGPYLGMPADGRGNAHPGLFHDKIVWS